MSNPKMAPDDVVFQSWLKLPTRTLPDDAPNTLTNIGQKSGEMSGNDAHGGGER
jgi:hypothetical protein